MTNLYFIRHGETDMNVRHRICGQIEADLTDKGVCQAENLEKFFGDNKIDLDLILSSTLRRAIQTAEILNRRFGVKIISLKGLQEVDFGTCEGEDVSDLKKQTFDPPYVCGSVVIRTGEELRTYHDSVNPLYDVVSHPNGESKIEARKRFITALSDYLDQNPELNHVAVVTHGAILRFVLSAIAPELLQGAVGNCQVFKLKYSAEKGLEAF